MPERSLLRSSETTILDRIKWKIKSPPSPLPSPPLPKKKDEATRKAKRAILPSLIWGEGDLNFPTILSKMVILDRMKWNSQPPSVKKIKDQAARKPKRAIFPFLI